jgi:cytochrome bd-type quinol oxidase subunit 2
MLIITILGFPLVLLYTAFVYRIFRGKTKAADAEY